MKAKKLLGIILAFSLVISLFTCVPLTTSAAGYDGSTFTFESYQWNFWGGVVNPTGNNNGSWSVESDNSLKYVGPGWNGQNFADVQPTISITSSNTCPVQGVVAGQKYQISVNCKMPCAPGFNLDVYATLLSDGKATSHNSTYDVKLGTLNANTSDWQTITGEVTVPSDYASASASNFGITLKPGSDVWVAANAVTVQLQSATVTPIVEVEEYNGTKFSYSDSYVWSNAVAPTDKNRGTYFGTSTTEYLAITSPGWGVLSNFAIGISDTSCTVNGVKPGKTYTVSVECAMPTFDNSPVDVYCTLLTDGKAANRDTTFSQIIGTLGSDGQAVTSFTTFTADVTVPESYTSGNTSNFGIYFKGSNNDWIKPTIQLKSATVTPKKSYLMKVDFSGYKNPNKGTNGVIRDTTWSTWNVVTEENTNTYLSVTKSKSEATESGTDTVENGLKIVVNEKAAASSYNDTTPLKDSYILEKGVKYFITLKYKLNFSDGADGTIPVKMMHSGILNTGVASLMGADIYNPDKRLEATDEWKQVTFAATTYSEENWGNYWEKTWDSFGLSFYEDALKDRAFTLCIDDVYIDNVNNYPEVGDTNLDAEIDILDLVRVKKHLSSGSTDYLNADLDGDESITDSDFDSLRRFILGVKKKISSNASALAQDFISKGYSLAWNDEFNGSSLDTSVWGRRPDSTLSNVATLSDYRVMQVNDGKLKMQIISYRDPDNSKIKYALPVGLTTAETLAYQYGYLEMRARMTFQQGVWHSLWLQGLTEKAQSYKDYETQLNGCLPEIDVFEIHTNATKCATPNLHLWKWDNVNMYSQHVQTPQNGVTGNTPYTFSSIENLSKEYHTYGFLWTPEKITMYIDGAEYITYNISSGNELWPGLGTITSEGNPTTDLTQDAFHSPMDIILGTGISTEENCSWDSSSWLDDSQFKGIYYYVDYIRLYQNNTINNTLLLK